MESKESKESKESTGSKKHTSRKITLPKCPRPGTTAFPFTVNNCFCQLLNGFKQLVIMIDVLGENTIYVRNYDEDLNQEQKEAFDGLYAWANAESGGAIPTPVPDPAPDPPIQDNVMIVIFSGTKTLLGYLPHDQTVENKLYDLLDSQTQQYYDVLCAWADSIDDRFLGSTLLKVLSK